MAKLSIILGATLLLLFVVLSGAQAAPATMHQSPASTNHSNQQLQADSASHSNNPLVWILPVDDSSLPIMLLTFFTTPEIQQPLESDPLLNQLGCRGWSYAR